jgi:hypothetical protein
MLKCSYKSVTEDNKNTCILSVTEKQAKKN